MESKGLQFTALHCSLAAVVSAIVALISVTNHGKTIQDLSWGVVHYKESSTRFQFNFGITGVYLTETTTTNVGTTTTTSVVTDLVRYSDCNESFCHPCHNSMQDVYGLLIGFFIVCIFAVGTNLTRNFYANTIVTKSACLAVSVVALILGIASVSKFANTCFSDVKDYFGGGTDISYSAGPACDVLIVALSLMFFEILVNAFVGIESDSDAPAMEMKAIPQHDSTV